MRLAGDDGTTRTDGFGGAVEEGESKSKTWELGTGWPCGMQSHGHRAQSGMMVEGAYTRTEGEERLYKDEFEGVHGERRRHEPLT